MALRTEFPKKGSEYLGGTSNGYEYQTLFSGASLKSTYQMVRQFLKEEGYGDVPVPADEQELLRFKYPRKRGQYLLFTERGYVHNPVKILFHPYRNRPHTLILCLYNESHPNHLLKFHGLMEEEE